MSQEVWKSGLVVLIVLGICLSSLPGQARGSEEADDLEKLGDALQILLPAGGFLSTFLAGNTDGGRWDRQGSWQSAVAFAGSWSTTYLWKYTAEKMRPNGHSRTSYPSGHTMGAFAGATFIDRRYGKLFGIPAYALATLTGYSRVQSDWHFADDVVAGASVSLLWGAAVVTPQPWSTSIRPFFADGNTGLLISVGGTPRPTEEQKRGPSKWRYEFAFGPFDLISNEISSPADAGTRFNLADFDKSDNPTTTAVMVLTHKPHERHEIDLVYGPFESRDQGKFSEPVNFAGVTFPADTLINSAWRMHDIRGRWRYSLVDTRWIVQGGGGLIVQDTKVVLALEDSTYAEVEDVAVLPFLHANLGFKFSKVLWVDVGGDWMSLPDDLNVDMGGVLTWQFHPRWEVSGGYHYFARQTSTQELTNRVEYHAPYLSVATLW